MSNSTTYNGLGGERVTVSDPHGIVNVATIRLKIKPELQEVVFADLSESTALALAVDIIQRLGSVAVATPAVTSVDEVKVDDWVKVKNTTDTPRKVVDVARGDSYKGGGFDFLLEIGPDYNLWYRKDEVEKTLPPS